MAVANKEIVLITGANTGLGLEVAKKLLRDHKGRFHVLIGARTPAKGETAVKELQAQGWNDCETIEINVSSDESIVHAMSEVEQRFGRLDVLHVNAGIAPPFEHGNERESLSQIIMRTMETNVAGAAQTAETFAPLLNQSANPRVIFMSSSIASIAGWEKEGGSKTKQQYPAYGASKAALSVIMLWYSHRHPNMSVNACSPGYRPTQINHYGADAPTVRPGPLEEGATNAVRLSLLGKDGETGTHTQTVDGTGEVVTVPW